VKAEILLPLLRRGMIIIFVSACLGIIANSVSSRGVPLLGPVPLPQIEGLEWIELKAAWKLYREKQGIFVDARTRAEFDAGHIPGALLLSQDTAEESVTSFQDLIPTDSPLVTYCAGKGCESSIEVAEILIDAGYSQVKVFGGGWTKWKASKYPVEMKTQPEKHSRN